MNLEQKISIKAPAKVNLHLAVKDKRADGFHNLESIFLAVDFADTLEFEPIEGKNALELIVEGLEELGVQESLPTEKNIVFKALSLFREKTGFTQGFRVKLKKRIPLGGGLGGGSSDAASTLLALNRFFAAHDVLAAQNVLAKGTLLEMAEKLGSDVPFFVHETPAAIVTGRGEKIEPITLENCFLVLVNPGFHSDTATAFRLLKAYRNSLHGDLHRDLHGEQKFFDKSSFLCAPKPSFFKSFYNDFLPVFPERERTIYQSIITKLPELGAEYANLSGAGSTCFGIFYKKEIAQKAVLEMRKTYNFVEICNIFPFFAIK